jgi:hypothetical protein
VPFADPDPYREITFENTVRAKLAIADLLGRPLARLSVEERNWINGVLADTLSKSTVLARVQKRFMTLRPRSGQGVTGDEIQC